MSYSVLHLLFPYHGRYSHQSVYTYASAQTTLGYHCCFVVVPSVAVLLPLVIVIIYLSITLLSLSHYHS